MQIHAQFQNYSHLLRIFERVGDRFQDFLLYFSTSFHQPQTLCQDQLKLNSPFSHMRDKNFDMSAFEDVSAFPLSFPSSLEVLLLRLHTKPTTMYQVVRTLKIVVRHALYYIGPPHVIDVYSSFYVSLPCELFADEISRQGSIRI